MESLDLSEDGPSNFSKIFKFKKKSVILHSFMLFAILISLILCESICLSSVTTVSLSLYSKLLYISYHDESFFFSMYSNLILGFVTSLSAIIGDLIESVFKRSCQVKDSGSLIPGRGGILDSIDSIVIAAPIFYIGYNFLF